MTYDDIKSDKTLHSLQTVYFLKYILRVKAWWIFISETSFNVFFILRNMLKKHEAQNAKKLRNM